MKDKGYDPLLGAIGSMKPDSPKALTLNDLLEVERKISTEKRAAQHRMLARLTGMNVVKNDYLPKGTIMVMVAEDVYEELQEQLPDPLEKMPPIFRNPGS